MCRPAALAAALAVAAALTTLAASAKPKSKKPTDPEELFNPLLGIEHSHWLVGPIVQIATAEEVEEYLSLATDGEAKRFVEEFWQHRGEGTGFLEKTPLQVFESRAEEADKRFTEGAFPGRLTDRGTVFILYGEPEEVAYDIPRNIDEPAAEVWKYPKDAGEGLDGENPKRSYRFVKIDDRTVFYDGYTSRRRQIEERNRRRKGVPY